MGSTLHLEQFRSAAGTSRSQRETLRSLGSGRIGQKVERADSPQLRGMVDVVRHLVHVNAPEAEGS